MQMERMKKSGLRESKQRYIYLQVFQSIDAKSIKGGGRQVTEADQERSAQHLCFNQSYPFSR